MRKPTPSNRANRLGKLRQSKKGKKTCKKQPGQTGGTPPAYETNPFAAGFSPSMPSMNDEYIEINDEFYKLFSEKEAKTKTDEKKKTDKNNTYIAMFFDGKNTSNQWGYYSTWSKKSEFDSKEKLKKQIETEALQYSASEGTTEIINTKLNNIKHVKIENGEVFEVFYKNGTQTETQLSQIAKIDKSISNDITKHIKDNEYTVYERLPRGHEPNTSFVICDKDINATGSKSNSKNNCKTSNVNFTHILANHTKHFVPANEILSRKGVLALNPSKPFSNEAMSPAPPKPNWPGAGESVVDEEIFVDPRKLPGRLDRRSPPPPPRHPDAAPPKPSPLPPPPRYSVGKQPSPPRRQAAPPKPRRQARHTSTDQQDSFFTGQVNFNQNGEPTNNGKFVLEGSDNLNLDYEEVESKSYLADNNKIKIIASKLENKYRNRYANILAFDSTRVKIESSKDNQDGYINANFITFDDGGNRKYIAAQGPNTNTIEDFWQMIDEQKPSVICMVTNLIEKGTEKCADYITENTIGNIENGGYMIEIRKLKSTTGHVVNHIWFRGWPDHGVPENTESLVLLSNLINKYTDPKNGGNGRPPVIHCSAGVGRTGTIIAINHILSLPQGAYNGEGLREIMKKVMLKMRDQRPDMIQTEDQYECVYNTIAKHQEQSGVARFQVSQPPQYPFGTARHHPSSAAAPSPYGTNLDYWDMPAANNGVEVSRETFSKIFNNNRIQIKEGKTIFLVGLSNGGNYKFYKVKITMPKNHGQVQPENISEKIDEYPTGSILEGDRGIKLSKKQILITKNTIYQYTLHYYDKKTKTQTELALSGKPSGNIILNLSDLGYKNASDVEFYKAPKSKKHRGGARTLKLNSNYNHQSRTKKHHSNKHKTTYKRKHKINMRKTTMKATKC